jgi:hypothetical protein
MKSKDIQVGGRYVAKVSGRLAVVQIVGESVHGGWLARNVETDRPVRIRSPQRLRRPADITTVYTRTVRTRHIDGQDLYEVLDRNGGIEICSHSFSNTMDYCRSHPA